MKQADAQLYLNTVGRIKGSSARNKLYWSVPGKSVRTKFRRESYTSQQKALWKVKGDSIAYTGHK